jgi:hypothetical protein
MGRACSTNGGKEDFIWDTDGEARWVKATRNTKSRWADNIKIDLREIGWDGMDWIHLAQDRYQ